MENVTEKLTRKWYLYGKRHRENGPAIEWPSGANVWYIDDYEYTEEVYNFIIKRRRRIYLDCWLTWTDFVMNPYTKRGVRFVDKQYNKLFLLKKDMV